MKKKVLIMLLCGIIVLGVLVCGRHPKFGVGKKSDIQIVQKDVSLIIKEGTLKNTGATLILTNNSNHDVQYGNPYEIEVKKAGEWYKTNVNLFFTLPSFILKAQETKEIELNWEYGYGKLPTGTYRIIKDIDYEYEEGRYESFYIAVEFTIE